MDLLNKCLNILMENGADKAEVSIAHQFKDEMNVNTGEISLLRSREEYNLNLTAIINNKKDFIQINKIDDKSIEAAALEVINNAKNSQPDEAHDISDILIEKEFKEDMVNLDLDLMHKRLKKFILKINDDYPELVISESILEYIDTHHYYANSKGVKLSSNSDKYTFALMFFSKKGMKTSSFNHTSLSTKDLEKELYELGSLPYLLKESIEHLDAQAIENKKFTGDIIVTPDCMNSVLDFLLSHISNYFLIAGISNFSDKLNEKVLDEKFTLRTEPLSKKLASKKYYGSDGILNKNDYIFENGVLKNYILDLYGSNKTGYDRGPSHGGNIVIEKGDKSLDEMIKSIDQGIILSRFSGGQPAPNGDFSGVAKNSFYIENGEIKYPIKETMITGNIFDMFTDINAISEERINNGSSLLPFIHFKDINISSK
ncbi:TldD/PmbA family protein [Natronospora cellulosivora (SeqCode)]